MHIIRCTGIVHMHTYCICATCVYTIEAVHVHCTSTILRNASHIPPIVDCSSCFTSVNFIVRFIWLAGLSSLEETLVGVLDIWGKRAVTHSFQVVDLHKIESVLKRLHALTFTNDHAHYKALKQRWFWRCQYNKIYWHFYDGYWNFFKLFQNRFVLYILSIKCFSLSYISYSEFKLCPYYSVDRGISWAIHVALFCHLELAILCSKTSQT